MMVYEIEYNTGDWYWDNDPIGEEYETLEEVIEELGERLTKEKLEELEKEGYICDDDGVEWIVRKI